MARKTTSTAESKQAVEQAEKNDNNQANMSENQTSSDTVTPEYTAYSRSRCGGALRTAREKQGLAIHDVASKLKISTRQIEAIEADQFASLPESTIVRGFIRNYAKLLKVDAEPLLDAYNVLVPSKEPLAFTVKPSTTMKVSSYQKPKTGRYIGAGLLIFLALGLWLFYQNYIEKPSPTIPTATTEQLEPLPQPALPAAERVEQSVDIALPPAVTGESILPADSTSTVATPAPASGTTANIVPPAEAIANLVLPEPKPTEATTGTAKLEFNANQETWISIVDNNGKEIYNKTIFAGSRENINVKPPVSVVVGNAGGATMTMNNKLIDLAPHTRSNVARVKLSKPEQDKFE